MARLPPPRVAAALLASSSTSAASYSLGPIPSPLLAASSGGRATIRKGVDATDSGLLERLEWVQGWVRGAATGDSDETCRMMAEACINIQAGVAKAALESLHHSYGKIPPGPISGGLLLPGSMGWGATEVQMITEQRSKSPLMVTVEGLDRL